MDNKNNGRLVKEFVTVYNINGEDQISFYIKNEKIDKIVFEFEYRGEYALGWLVGYKENKEIYRFQDRYAESIDWE